MIELRNIEKAFGEKQLFNGYKRPLLSYQVTADVEKLLF